ncbi:N-formylglutamate amidohydrolase [Pontibacter sp. MBLB2868]|uniref:N-formylglutamate amidohydrolase n=1 Tax=Pontibacter sp. MBLB2868 TaxID=3451555 RepID=UPI003F74D9ED
MLKLLLTCEHGGNEIPAEYQPYFMGHQKELASHLGYDIGALDLFKDLEDMADVSFFSQTSRLLVELNRSLHHKKLFSDISGSISDKQKNEILKNYYYPYRDGVEQMVHDLTRAGRRVLHISIHSFTPVLDGEERKADIGILYDPKRRREQAFCRDWKQQMLKQMPDLLIRNNYPYLGISDGLPTYLRKKFREKEYLGIELEVNQKFPLGDQEQWQALKAVIRQALKAVIQEHCPGDQQPEQVKFYTSRVPEYNKKGQH